MRRVSLGNSRFAACAFAAFAAAAAPALAGGRLARAEFELEGPLAGFTVHAGRGGHVRVERALAPGEVLNVVLPLPLAEQELVARPEPLTTFEVGAVEGPRGRARFVRWVEDPGADALAALSPGLAARARPRVRAEPAEVGLAGLAALFALAAVVVAARRRPLLALCVAAPGAGLAAWAVRPPPQDARAERVVDGAEGVDRWLETRAGADELALSRELVEGGGRLATEPADAPIEVELADFATGPARLRSRGATLLWLRAVPARSSPLELERNDALPIFEAWMRVEGAWSALGAWPIGAPRPAGAPGEPGEGWLLGGLPQGADVFVARGADAEGEVWLRITR